MTEATERCEERGTACFGQHDWTEVGVRVEWCGQRGKRSKVFECARCAERYEVPFPWEDGPRMSLWRRIACRLGAHDFEPWRKVPVWSPSQPRGSFVYESRCRRHCGVTRSEGSPWGPAGIEIPGDLAVLIKRVPAEGSKP